MKVGVIDYGVGNLGSVIRALEELRVSPILINRAIDLHIADCLILPGVGNFSDCIQILDSNDWSSALRDEVIGYERPLLGVCLGMQLLASASMEGVDGNQQEGISGLGFIPGKVVHLRSLGCTQRVPHVGWNSIKSCNSDHLFRNIPDGTDFYFVHSYAFVPEDSKNLLATTEYDVQVSAAVRSGHVWGTQFHPEKSSRAGFQLLRNFIDGEGC
ncbi:MAG: imidazole glycerol phosphate synthase subunit HisH [Gammaproteobacteria bacterium]|nr:MAG: imidazole glycerol phosphate synthase subunit HisH [Gammaproteobacteria bacterium]